MKKVFSTHEMLAHAWAQQSQAEGRSGDGRMFFDGPNIFSYGRHFCIAGYVKNKNGTTVVLWNDNSYSISTSKHQGLARHAIQGDVPIVRVRDPAQPVEWNLAKLDDDIKHCLTRYGTTKHGGAKKKLLRMATGYIDARNTIGEHFVKRYKPVVLGVDMQKHVDKLVKAEAQRMAQAEKKRLADIEASIKLAEKNLGRTRDKWPEMWRRGYNNDKDLVKRAAWHRAQYYIENGEGILLRRKGDNIHTSKGAEFPVTHAKRVFKFIRSVWKADKEYIANANPSRENTQLGIFKIDRITPDGDVIAGCHKIKKAEISRMATTLGLAVQC
jgi:hypothetical protein